MIDKELPVVSKDEARKLSEEAMARFMSQGGSVEQLKGGGKIMSDPTARFPKKD